MRIIKPDARTKYSERVGKMRPLPFWIKFFGSGFYSGFFPVAPGTAGSAIALLMYWFIPGFDSLYILSASILLFLFVGIYTASKIEQVSGHDPSVVVIDEIVGMWIALWLLPKNFIAAIAAFFLFRFFDIIKPPPARQFDRMSGGVGIMMDDVIAGLYANIVLRLIIFILPRHFFI